jgi:hypothetical protein
MKGEPLRCALSDAGQPRQLGDEPVDGWSEQNSRA